MVHGRSLPTTDDIIIEMDRIERCQCACDVTPEDPEPIVEEHDVVASPLVHVLFPE